SRTDDLREFLVIQNSIAGNFLRRQGDAFGGRLIEHRPAHAPAQERLERLQGLVGGDGSPTLLDRGDDLNHVSLADLMDAPTAPPLADLPAKEPRDLATGAVL